MCSYMYETVLECFFSFLGCVVLVVFCLIILTMKSTSPLVGRDKIHFRMIFFFKLKAHG